MAKGCVEIWCVCVGAGGRREGVVGGQGCDSLCGGDGMLR